MAAEPSDRPRRPRRSRRPRSRSARRSASVRLRGLPCVRRMRAETSARSPGSSRSQWSRPARRISNRISQGARRRSMLGHYPAGAVRHAPSWAGKLSGRRGILGGMRTAVLLALPAVSVALAACGSGSSHNAGSSTSGAGPAIVTSAEKAKVGSVIVDAQGRTLYRFTAEAQGRPVCTGACVATWPPATVSAAGGPPAHLATVRRPDGGKLQLTYDGHPLYRYAGDRSTADANGEGLGGQWYAVKAGGGGGGGTSTQDSKRSYGY